MKLSHVSLVLAGLIFVTYLALHSPLQSRAQSTSLPGDANHDGKISLADFQVWRTAYIGGTQPTPTPTACTGVAVSPSDDIQAVVDAHPAGTTYCLSAGLWREQSVTPKAGDTYIGTGQETILSGARILEPWINSGSSWYVGGQTQEGQVHGECGEIARCGHPEDLFIDNEAQVHVSSLAEIGPGKWFFDYAADRIYVGSNPSGHTVETSVTRHAFQATETDNITIKNLVVEKYAQPAQFGAIQSGDFGTGVSRNWMIDGVIARYNHGTGISLFNNNDSTITNSKMLYNMQKGVGIGGKNDQLLNSESAHNNFLHAFDAGWEAGGSKFAFTDNLLLKGNSVHDNGGPGLWTDIDNINSTIENNTVTNNEMDGIFHEISYKATIRNNHVEGNGWGRKAWCYGAGITVSASRDVEVSGNTIIGNYNSISGIAQTRGDGQFGAHELRGLNAHDNMIQGGMDGKRSVTGVCRDNSDPIHSAEWNNHFDSNTYYGPLNSWGWNDQELTDFSAWQAAGQDTNGSNLPNQQIPGN